MSLILRKRGCDPAERTSNLKRFEILSAVSNFTTGFFTVTPCRETFNISDEEAASSLVEKCTGCMKIVIIFFNSYCTRPGYIV